MKIHSRTSLLFEYVRVYFTLFFMMFLVTLLDGVSMPATILSGNLVEIQSVDPSITVDLPYATIYNFTGKKLYPKPYCYVHMDTAMALSAVQRDLAAHGYGLKIWDGYRPISLEQEISHAPTEDRVVHHPKQADRHARGTGVSVTLVDRQGLEIAMPTPFDIFTERTLRDFQSLSEDVIFHRTLLEQAMERHGFIPYARLWWHFDLKDYEKYPILDIPLVVLDHEYEITKKQQSSRVE